MYRDSKEQYNADCLARVWPTVGYLFIDTPEAYWPLCLCLLNVNKSFIPVGMSAKLVS